MPVRIKYRARMGLWRGDGEMQSEVTACECLQMGWAFFNCSLCSAPPKCVRSPDCCQSSLSGN